LKPSKATIKRRRLKWAIFGASDRYLDTFVDILLSRQSFSTGTVEVDGICVGMPHRNVV
jgi:hypothetical protein